MNEIVIPGLYLLSGICAYAAINHLYIGLHGPRGRVHLLFSGMCLLMAIFGLCQAWGYRAETVAEFSPALKWSLAAAAPFYILFLRFLAEYTGVRSRPLLTGLSLLFAGLFVVNLMQPYSLQFEHIQGIERLHLPWGEVLAKPVGRISNWFYLAVAAVLTAFGYALYALGARYRRDGGRTVLIMLMLLAAGLFEITAIEGLLVRLSVIDFVFLGPFGFLSMVIAMGVTLSYETQERLRVSESRFRSLVEQSPFSIQMLSPDGRTRTVNPAWERLWGLKLDALTDYNILHDQQLVDKGAMPYIERGFAGVAAEIPTIVYNPADNPVVRGPYRDRRIRAHLYPTKDATGRVSEVILMHEDVTEKKRVEDAIREIAAGVSAASGQEFFRRLVQHLAKLFDADYAYIGLLPEDNPESINTLVVCAHGKIAANFSYALAGTPCANVVGQETRVYLEPRHGTHRCPAFGQEF